MPSMSFCDGPLIDLPLYVFFSLSLVNTHTQPYTCTSSHMNLALIRTLLHRHENTHTHTHTHTHTLSLSIFLPLLIICSSSPFFSVTIFTITNLISFQSIFSFDFFPLSIHFIFGCCPSSSAQFNLK